MSSSSKAICSTPSTDGNGDDHAADGTGALSLDGSARALAQLRESREAAGAAGISAARGEQYRLVFMCSDLTQSPSICVNSV
ncbi:hypothetical protein [Stenotrophomonas maltophilia]|uniref:hypothetical protein n=1 Tax=Stenotrophomonas maltophilia TaxID=40324 RepID=UPI0011B38653|nr:hypothetical protein [Stenotrophomonas maltophilia]